MSAQRQGPRFRGLIGLLAAMLLLGMTQVSATGLNLLANGSFEEPAVPVGWLIEPVAIPGWIVDSGCGIEIQNNVAGSPLDGAQHVELDSWCPSTIYQDVPTLAGRAYTLRFGYSPRPGVVDNSIKAYWDGAEVTHVNENGYGLGGTNWQYVTTLVTASAGTSRLALSDVSLNDGFGGYIDDVTLLPVNSAPAITEVTGNPAAVGSPLTIAASFTDPDTPDLHTATIDWSDGSPAQTVTPAGMTVSGSHVYGSVGVYTATVTVTDYYGERDTMSALVVVYDPKGGFVTGGGWFDSPAGKVSIQSVARYNNGSTLPTGETNVQLPSVGSHFHSTSYDWLVVTGDGAQYQGSGRINGVGEYGFRVTLSDSRQAGIGRDKVRIKIWDKSSSTIVYDNQPGDPDGAAPITALGGGSIVIHKGR